jgi:lipopolysaccharide export system protein LptA
MSIQRHFGLMGIVYFSLMLTNWVSGQEEPMVIQSGEAEYNGREISLVGQVVVQHELGQLSSHQLKVIPNKDKDKKKRFSFLKLKEDVLIKSKDGSTLACQEADIDYAQLKGIFLGDEKYRDVVYTNQEQQKGSEQDAHVSLIVKSNRMQVKLLRQYDPESQSHKSSIHQMQADQHVRAYYNQDYLVLADHAFYQKLPNDETLFLYSDTWGEDVCQIKDQNGDQLQANRITVDLIKRQMVLENPRGMIWVKQEDLSLQPVHFSARHSIWDEKEQILLLQQDVKLYQEGFGRIETDKEVKIYQSVIDGKKGIRSIVSNEETDLTYADEKNGTAHKIICHGPLIVDHEHLDIWMNSPVNEEGNSVQDKQVYFEHLAGDVYADQVHIKYEWNNQNLVPTKIIMRGHVLILNRFNGHLQESGSILQYALADLVEYFPNNEEMFLYGQGQRVLLFDKVNNLQMSAPALRIRRDGTSKKELIQGIGDVRFTFIEHEFTQLKQRFHLAEEAQ